MGPNRVRTVDIPTLIALFIFCKKSRIVMIQNQLVRPKISSFKTGRFVFQFRIPLFVSVQNGLDVYTGDSGILFLGRTGRPKSQYQLFSRKRSSSSTSHVCDQTLRQ
jgi:hypothetical protein